MGQFGVLELLTETETDIVAADVAFEARKGVESGSGEPGDLGGAQRLALIEDEEGFQHPRRDIGARDAHGAYTA